MAASTFLLFAFVSLIHGKSLMVKDSFVNNQKTEKLCRDVFHINNMYYSLEETKTVTGMPADMAVQWRGGNIFFTLISDKSKMSLVVLHPGGEIETIKLSGLGQSTAVDNLNDVIYLATDNGVYKYNEDGSVKPYTAIGEDVMYIAVTKDGIDTYIATWPQNRVQKITNDGQKKEPFPSIPNGHGLKVDTRDNMYFMAANTLYVLRPDSQVPVKIKGLPNDKLTGVFISSSDEVFAMDEESKLYSIDPYNSMAKYLGEFNVTGVNTFAMDSADNMYIGVDGAILKFDANEKADC